jgi:hypothetical protein
LLKQKCSISADQQSAILNAAYAVFLALVQPHVRTYV